MTWAIIPLLALLLGLANHDRGRGVLMGGRWMCAIIGGLGIGFGALLLGFEPLRALATAFSTTLGFYNWLVWGWGLYFAAFTWQWHSDETEVSWIDHVVLFLVPWKTDSVHWTNGLRGALGMALRGLYLIPMFLLIDPIHLFTLNHVWWLGLLGPIQGVLYAANHLKIFEGNGTAYPELAMGMFIGALSGMALYLLQLQGV